MITRLIVRNFKSLRELNFNPTPGVNILVGDNEAGKSSLLEALSLVLTGRLAGRRANEEISPYWFNQAAVQEFFDATATGDGPEPPSILIEAFFDKNDQPATLRGKVNELHEDVPGLHLEISLDPDYIEDFRAYIQSNPPPVLPTEYFHVRWTDFREVAIQRRPSELGLVLIDSRTVRSNAGLDWQTRQMIQDFSDKQRGAQMSVDYRNSRVKIASKMLEELNAEIAHQTKSLSDKKISLGANLETGGWESTVVPQLDATPLQYAGQGQQVMIKAALALQSSSETTRFILIEEPENHLSHTNLRKLLTTIQTLAEGRQTFIATHSSYVLNRLGLDKLRLMDHGNMCSIGDLTPETVNYFQRQSGFDTLRVVLSERIVLVEGPSDEMVFNRAYKDTTGHDPDEHGIDVITYGTQNRRPLELCAALKKSAAALRDNDDEKPSHWRELAHDVLEEGVREMFIGNPADGRTLEPQLVTANSGTEASLKKIVGCPDSKDLAAFMIAGKTESAWKIATSNTAIKYPRYVLDAIDFIRPR